MAGVVLFLFAFGVEVNAESRNAARAWLVSKGEARAVLVGETHLKTAIEFNDYYEAIVKPSFLAADMAILEPYRDPRQIHAEMLHKMTACSGELSDRSTERLQPAIDELIEVMRKNKLEAPNWLVSWQLMPEQLMASHFLDLSSEKVAPSWLLNPSPASAAQYFTNGVSWQFKFDPKLAKTPAKLLPLDSAASERLHFCSATAAERQDYLVEKVRKLTMLGQLKLNGEPPRATDEILKRVESQFMRIIACVDTKIPCDLNEENESVEFKYLRPLGFVVHLDDGNYSISLKKRTHAWVPIIKQAIEDHNKTFVLVGAMHLPDLRVNDRIEPGLISLLRKEGFTIRPIDTVDDIKSTLLAKTRLRN